MDSLNLLLRFLNFGLLLMVLQSKGYKSSCQEANAYPFCPPSILTEYLGRRRSVASYCSRQDQYSFAKMWDSLSDSPQAATEETIEGVTGG